MKPTYTVRLTGDLEPDERTRIAARVAGVTEIGADKIERLLERGAGRDLIKPSSASVANRLATVLAEAGAPVRLTPVTESVPTPSDAGVSTRAAPAAADRDVLRPRQSGSGRDAPASSPDASRGTPTAASPASPTKPSPAEPVADRTVEPVVESATPRVEPAVEPATPPAEPTVPRAEPSVDAAREAPEKARPAITDRPIAADEIGTAPPSGAGARAAPPEPEAQAAPDLEPEAPPEPEVTVTAPADPAVRARPTDPQREPPPPPRTIDPPPRPPRVNGGTAILGAIGAAVLGIGAVFAMDLLVSPIAIGVLVLAVLALALSLLGQRRATWLPGFGALALIVWALANSPDGLMPTLAANWQWYAMFAGALLVIVAGFQEAQRGRVR